MIVIYDKNTYLCNSNFTKKFNNDEEIIPVDGFCPLLWAVTVRSLFVETSGGTSLRRRERSRLSEFE